MPICKFLRSSHADDGFGMHVVIREYISTIELYVD